METTPTTPTTALASVERPAPSTSRSLIALGIAAVIIMGMLALAFVSARLAAQGLATELKQLREDNAAALRHSDKRMRDLIDSVQAIEINSPPTNDKLFSILSRGIGQTENVVRTGQVGTTPQSAFVTDLTTAQQVDAYTQEIVITNRDNTTAPATNNLCFSAISWAAAGANCTAKCAASGLTCPAVGGAGAATDGTLTPRGSSWNRRYDGTSCICIVGSAADVEYQTERVIR